MERLGDPASEDAVHTRPLGFYFLKPEIIPHNAYGTHRFDASGQRIEEFEVRPSSLCELDRGLTGGACDRMRLSTLERYWRHSAFRTGHE